QQHTNTQQTRLRNLLLAYVTGCQNSCDDPSLYAGGSMLETSDRLRARLTTSCAVSRPLARPLDELGVVPAVHAQLARVMEVTICFFGRYDAAGQSVEVVWQFHDGEELPGGHFPLGDGPTSQAIRRAQPQLIRELSRERRPVQVQYATQRPSLPESMMVVPIVFDSTVIGVLSMQSYRPGAYDDEDVARLQGVADQMAVALVGAQYRAATGA